MDAHSFSISHKQQGLGWREEEMNESVLNYKCADLKYGEKNALIYLGDKQNWMLFKSQYELLGLYIPRTGEIDFEHKIQEQWVERGKIPFDLYYRNYLKSKHDDPFDFIYTEDSFISLLKTETEKAFPLKDMPHKFVVLKIN